MTLALAPAVMDGLARGLLLLAVVLTLAFALGRLGFSARPAARHAVILGVLAVGAASPLWLRFVSKLTSSRPTVTAGLGGSFREVAEPLLGWLRRPQMRTTPTGASAVAGAESGCGQALFGVWLAGLAWALVRLAHGVFHAHLLRRSARALPQAFDSSDSHAITAPVRLSDQVGGAVLIGIWRPTVLLSPSVLGMSAGARAQILAHENAHADRRDPLLGLLVRLLAAVYWFHPLVHLAARSLGRAREEACDDRVRAQHPAASYARTLLALASCAIGETAGIGIGISSRRSPIEQRIRRLLAPVDCHGRWSSALFGIGAVVAIVLVTAQAARAVAPIPIVAGSPTGLAQSHPLLADFDPGTAAELAQLAAVAPGSEGSFVLRPLAGGRDLIVNPTLAAERATPASTFKVIIGLLALETGVAPDETFTLPWNGQRHEIEIWNHPQDLTSAMRTSATWYFQELQRRLDPALIRRFLVASEYGNHQVDGRRDFWLNGSLLISPLEQVEVLSRLARGELAVSPRSHALLDKTMRLDSDGASILYGKTGTAIDDDRAIAWLVGHVQRGRDTFVFATFLRGPASAGTTFIQKRLALTRQLLAGRGVMTAGHEE